MGSRWSRYNADGGKANQRLAYIGQDNYQSGLEMGARIVSLVTGGQVCLFIATPNQQNIQPRIDGALDAIRDSGKPIKVHVVASGVDVATERKKIEASYQANKNVRGLFAVDAGSTAGVAQVMRAHGLHAKGVRAGGYDLLPETLRRSTTASSTSRSTSSRTCRAFCRCCSCSSTATAAASSLPPDTNTGLTFVTRANVARYLTTKSRYEGSSSAEAYPVEPR